MSFDIFPSRWASTVIIHSIAMCLLLVLDVAAYSQSAPGSTDLAAARLAEVIAKVQAHPVDAITLEEALGIGFSLLRSGRYEQGLSVFAAISDANHGLSLAAYGRALALFNLGHIPDAEQQARAAIALSQARENLPTKESSGRVDALVLLGVILAVKGNSAEALAVVREAVGLNPDNFDAQLALGRALYGAGDHQNAALAFRKAIALRPDDAKSRFFLATTLEAAGDYEKARAVYVDLIKIHPDNTDGHLGLGVLLVKLGDDFTEEGIRELVSALSLDGDLYEARIVLGRTLIRLGRMREAVEHLTRAAQLAPNNPEPHYQLAIAYRRLGKKAEAEQESGRVREINSAHRVTESGSQSRRPLDNRD